MNGLCSSASRAAPATKICGEAPEEGEDSEEAIAFAAMDREASASSFAERLIQRVRDFFGAIVNFFRGRGFDTRESIFDKVDKVEFGERLRTQPVDAPGAGRHVAGIRAKWPPAGDQIACDTNEG